IKSVRIENFRSILDETFECDSLTALVGPNGVGKSSVLRGLDLFYSQAPKVELEDFYNEETASELSVAVTFKDLSAKAGELFAAYLQGDTLTVERVFSFVEGRMSWKYYGATLQQPAFTGIREAFEIKDRSATAKTRYNEVRAKAEFSDLPAWANAT